MTDRLQIGVDPGRRHDERGCSADSCPTAKLLKHKNVLKTNVHPTRENGEVTMKRLQGAETSVAAEGIRRVGT
jgi:hypothetical protein